MAKRVASLLAGAACDASANICIPCAKILISQINLLFIYKNSCDTRDNAQQRSWEKENQTKNKQKTPTTQCRKHCRFWLTTFCFVAALYVCMGHGGMWQAAWFIVTTAIESSDSARFGLAWVGAVALLIFGDICCYCCKHCICWYLFCCLCVMNMCTAMIYVFELVFIDFRFSLFASQLLLFVYCNFLLLIANHCQLPVMGRLCLCRLSSNQGCVPADFRYMNFIFAGFFASPWCVKLLSAAPLNCCMLCHILLCKIAIQLPTLLLTGGSCNLFDVEMRLKPSRKLAVGNLYVSETQFMSPRVWNKVIVVFPMLLFNVPLQWKPYQRRSFVRNIYWQGKRLLHNLLEEAWNFLSLPDSALLPPVACLPMSMSELLASDASPLVDA